MKRIILLLDGTWNDSDFGDSDTNIVRIEDIIARSLDADQVTDTNADQAPGALVRARGFKGNNIEHLVFYERGVGTAALDRMRGGVFGMGLAANIRRAYRILSFHYEPGDEVFVFGFSRGAYTARSLVGFIGAVGLLKSDDCTKELEQLAWQYYRTPPNDRLPGIWTSLSPHVHERAAFRIACLGMFDTVGALGIPLTHMQLWNRDRYEFHDVNLSSITRVNLHALAIDEHREPFQATIWRKPRFKAYTSVTEQVWFPGAHADIGGGYIGYDARATKELEALDDIALDWMLRRLRHHFPKFPVKSRELRDPGSKTVIAQQHEPRNRIYELKRFALRSIANYQVPVPRNQRCVSFDRHATPTGEMVHISALERLGKVVRVEGSARLYEPQNLLAVLRHIQATYSGYERSPGTTDIPVVDWSGEVLEPSEQVAQDKVRETLQCAAERLPKVHEMLDQLPSRSPPPICSLDDDANVRQRNYEAEVRAE
jgi:type VI secretion system (T6SS) phospholipase Tle1-like effector